MSTWHRENPDSEECQRMDYENRRDVFAAQMQHQHEKELMETINDQAVAVQGDKIVIMLPKRVMTKEEALRHAAWLAVLADTTGDDFEKVLEAIRNT